MRFFENHSTTSINFCADFHFLYVNYAQLQVKKKKPSNYHLSRQSVEKNSSSIHIMLIIRACKYLQYMFIRKKFILIRYRQVIIK